MKSVMFQMKCCALPAIMGAGFLITLLGCGSGVDRQAVGPVRGTVLVNGKPAAGAVVWFHPLGELDSMAVPSRGTVGNDGVFELTTYAKTDGAPTGDYAVTVYWPDAASKPPDEDDSSTLPPDLLQGRFATKQTSVLRAKIGDKAAEFAPVDLGSAEVMSSQEYFLKGSSG